jgi:alpha-beta hydrolase superfamily lysophospholipase
VDPACVFEQHVSDQEAVRRTVELDAVHVLGHSWGGLVAALYAARYPEHTSEKGMAVAKRERHDESFLESPAFTGLPSHHGQHLSSFGNGLPVSRRTGRLRFHGLEPGG